jgi:RHS repeat-associated protein
VRVPGRKIFFRVAALAVVVAGLIVQAGAVTAGAAAGVSRHSPATPASPRPSRSPAPPAGGRIHRWSARLAPTGGAPRKRSQPGFPGLAVFVGYADGVHGGGLFPSPWDGSPNVIFEGCTGGCSFDGGAILIQNITSSTMTIAHVTASIGSCTFDIWPKDASLPAGRSLIYAQETDGASEGCTTDGTFDTSDVLNYPQCVPDGTAPVVNITVGSATDSYVDSGEVLDTGSVDPGGCSSGSNESQQWVPIGSSPFPGSPGESTAGGVPGDRQTTCSCGAPVNTATGEFWHTFTDLAVPGRGMPLDFTRTYSTNLAATSGPLGFGWTDSYNMSLVFDTATGDVTVHQADGSQVIEVPNGAGGYSGPSWDFAAFTANADGTYTYARSTGQSYLFNGAGQLVRQIDRNGYVTTLAYNGSGQLTKVTDPAGRALTLAYTGSGNIASVTDPAGRVVSYSYDGSGNLAQVTNPANGAWTFGYNAKHLMIRMTNPRGGSTSNTYDSSGRVSSQTDPKSLGTGYSYSAGLNGQTSTIVTDPRGNQTQYIYSGIELIAVTRGLGSPAAATAAYFYDPGTLGVTAVTDANGNTTRYSYDAEGNQLSKTDPNGHTWTYTYNSFGEVRTATDPLGVTTSSTYDAHGNLLSTSAPAGTQTATTSYAYGDAAHPGDVTAMTDPNGHTWAYAYDADGDRTSVTDPLGHKATDTYNTIGERLTAVSARGNTTSYAYDALGDVTGVTDPLGHTTSYTYDAGQNLLTVTDASGNATSYSYDPDNQQTVARHLSPTGIVVQTTKTSYDADGNVSTQTDGLGNSTSYGYDPLNRLTGASSPAVTTSYGYDAAGNLTSVTDGNGNTTSYAYDAANRLTGIGYGSATTPDVGYGYDADGRRISMTDGTGTSHYTYDSLGRLTKVTDGTGATVSYGYDLDGNITALTYPNGKTVTRTFTAAGQLASVTDWLGHTTAFGYDPDGNLASEAYPNGVAETASYDKTGQPATITDSLGTTTLAGFSYTRGTTGLVTSAATTGISGPAQNYTYTPLNQLASANGAPFSYDKADDLTRFPAGASQAFTPGGELSSTTVPASAAVPVLDQQVSGDQGSLGTNITSPPISTKGSGELLLAFVSASGPPSGTQTITGVTGGGLTWTKVTRADRQPGTAEIWQAYAATPVTSAKITATLAVTGQDGSITVAAFTGAAPVTGAHATANGATKTPSVLLTTTQPHSLVWAAGEDATHASTLTPATGQAVVHGTADVNAHATYWAQDATQPVTTAGTTVNMADTLPAADHWNLAAVEIPSATGSAVTTSYGYDGNGNLTQIAPGNAPAVTLGYDQANRLISYGRALGYGYNGDGLRMSKTVSGQLTTFTWDTSGSLPLMLVNGPTDFVYGPGGQPLERVLGSAVTYLHTDAAGSVRLITNSAGQAAGTYSYTAYGQTLSHTGTAISALQYDGQFTDSETGLTYLRARYYAPATAQFLSVDPAVLATQAPYSYAADDPVNAADSSGLYVWGQCGGVSVTFDSGFGVSQQQCSLHQTNSYLVMSVAALAESISPAATIAENRLFPPKVVTSPPEVHWGTPSLGASSGEYGSTAPTIDDVQNATGCYSLGGSAGSTLSVGLDVTWNCTGTDGQQYSAGELSAGIGPPGRGEIHGSLSVLDAVGSQISRWVSDALCELWAFASDIAS